MINNILSDNEIQRALGERVRALRLRKNFTQKELAQATMISLNAIKSMEAGRGKLINLIAILRELGEIEQLDNFLPEVSISPIQLAKAQGKERKRATGGRGKYTANANDETNIKDGSESSW